MVDTAARLAILARRNEVLRFTIVVTGIDLTGVAMNMQVRLARGSPGVPRIQLGTVNTAAAEGLKLDSVTVVNGITTSIIKGRINQTTMSDASKVPYDGEIGTDTILAYAMQWTLNGDANTRIEGEFIVRDTAYGSDNAPPDRPPSYSGSLGTVSGASSGSLTFGDQVIRVSIDGADIVGPVAARAEAAAVRAEQAASRLDTLEANAIPPATSVTATTISGTTNLALTFPAGVTLTNGSMREFTVPVDIFGPVTITTAENPSGTFQHKNRDGGQFSGLAYPSGTVVRMKWSAAGNLWDAVSADLPVYVGQAIDVRARQALDGASLITGATWAIPIASNVNNLTAAVPGFLPDVKVDVLFLYDNTAETILTVKDANGVTRSGPIARGGGVSFAAGELKRGDVWTLSFSVGGGRFVAFGEPRSVIMKPITKEDIGTSVLDIRDQPWGTVGTGNAVAQTQVIFTSAGSSVGTDDGARQGGAPANYAPVKVLVDEVNALWPLDGALAVADNRSKGGAVFEQFPAQLAESAAYTTGKSRFVLLVGGMNCFQIPGYNLGVTYEGSRLKVVELIEANKAKGMKTLLCTTPHPRTTVIDYAGYYTSNPTAPQVYPYAVAAPVNPETGQYPPASKSKGLRDMTGFGTLSEYDLRFWHGNRMLREMARLYPNDCILLDAEYAWFRYGVEVYGTDALYDAGEVVHPNILGHKVSYGRVLKQFAADFTAGRMLQRIYRGDATMPMLGLPLITQGELGSPITNNGKIARIPYEGTEAFVGAQGGAWRTLTLSSPIAIAFNFATGSMPSGATLARPAGAATRVNSAGFIETTTAADIARFDYAPVSKALRGLLVEPARTNRLLSSAALDAAIWSKNGATVATGLADPAGGTAADALVEDATTGLHYAYQGNIAGAGATSVFAKMGERRWIALYSTSLATAVAYFDLLNGVVGQVIGAGITASITDAGQGWYRCTLVDTTAANHAVGVLLAQANGITSYPGTAGSKAVFYGFQNESMLSSYIPTSGAAAMRPADILTLDWGSLGVADSTITARYTFDDNSTQDVATVVAGGKSTVVGGTLNRSCIRRVELVAA